MSKNLLLVILLLCSCLSVTAQHVEIKGVVRSSSDDKPLPGVTVIELGTTNGTVTNSDGGYSITASPNSSLQFSFIGFETLTETIAGRLQVNVILSEEAYGLDEVIAVGYQTQRKIDLTGAVGVVDMSAPVSQSNANPLNSLQGKVAGVQINTDAAPGGGSTTIRIRGMSTVNDNSPLFIIDGIPTTENLNSINSNDIESIQVLKDAASASIYGSRAANGVVVITTKKGSGDRLRVNVNVAGSFQSVIKTTDMLNSEQWGEVYWQANGNDDLTASHPFYGSGAEPRLRQYLDNSKKVAAGTTDWQDQIYRSAWAQNYGVTVTNGTQKGSAMFSANYSDQDGLMKHTYFKRYSVRVNTNYKLGKYFNIGENLMVAKWNDLGYGTQDDRGVPYTAMRQHPAIPVYDSDGNFTNPLALAQSDIENPVHMLRNGKDNSNSSWRIFGNAFLEFMPVKGLTVKTNLGVEHVQFFNQELERRLQESDRNGVSRGYGQGDTWTWTNTANYSLVKDRHRFNILAGSEAISYKYEGLSAYRDGYQFEDAGYMIIDAGEGTQTNGGGKTSWALFSLFAKADYNYGDRYLASATVRRDATSRLYKKNNSGIFPAFSAAWRITEESFFPRTQWLYSLKLRAGWGQTGNAAINNNYASYSTYRYDQGNGAYDLTGSNSGAVAGIIVAAMGNENLKWETTTQTSVGLDASLLRGKLNLSLDYYIKNTDDMLTVPPTLAVAGENAAVWMNTGSMKNRGFELTVTYASPDYGDFSWGGQLNLSKYKNKVTKLNNLVKFEGGDYRLMEGQPMGVYYGYVADGLFQTDDQVRNHASQSGKGLGRMIYRDLNHDGVIDENDQTVIGDPNPDLSMGLSLDFSYKNFTISCFFTGDFGFDIYNTTKRQLDFMTYGGTSTNRGKNILNAWTPQNTNTAVPALTLLDTNNETRMSTYYIEDGSYVKMKYIKLSYSLPRSIAGKMGAGGIDVFAQVENLFTITKYSGLDPELPLARYGARVDMMPYPIARTFSLGINLSF